MKGFTLVELLAVIAILSIVALITVPNSINTINSSKIKACQAEEEQILDATKRYVNDNTEIYALTVSNGVTKNFPSIKINTLETNNYLKKGMINSKTNKQIDPNLEITIKWDGTKFIYNKINLGCEQ